MAGHSHWAQVKHKKAQLDVKRGQILNKLINNIVIAARQGADPEKNFKLRNAIEQAKEFNVPKENIEKAIKRGAGLEIGGLLEEIIYEGYGPEGVAIIVKAITDNRNRSSAQVKSVFNRYEAKFAPPGSVIWNFEEKGVILIDKERITEEELLNFPLKDIIDLEEGYRLIMDIEKMNEVKDKLENLGITPKESKIEFIPKSYIEISSKAKEKLQTFIDELLDLDDVQEVFTNLKE